MKQLLQNRFHIQKNQLGFTLLEVLIIFFILSQTILLSSAFLLHRHSTLQIQIFLQQLQEDIRFAQAFAVTHERIVVIDIHPLGEEYKIFSYYPATNRYITLITRSLNEETTLLSYTQTNPFHFNSAGNISRAGTLKIQFKEKNYFLVFNVGKGRFYLYE